MNLKEVERSLRNSLGGTYGGPSLSYDKDKREFILYSWGDAPVGTDELARGKTLSELFRNYDSMSNK